eukprot:6210697-Pleurochrysis_carterae.AAC.2
MQDKSNARHARTGQAEEPLTASPIQAAATSSVGRPLEQPSGPLLRRRRLKPRLCCKHCCREGRSSSSSRSAAGVSTEGAGKKGALAAEGEAPAEVALRRRLARWLCTDGKGFVREMGRASSCCVFRLIVQPRGVISRTLVVRDVLSWLFVDPEVTH